MKKEHPILFSTPMVQAILQGRKTQTRRIVKIGKNIDDAKFGYTAFTPDRSISVRGLHGGVYGESFIKCPYGKKGDLLWVRETWNTLHEFVSKPDYSVIGKDEFVYKADEDRIDKWRPSIFMPKEAARLFLEITNIRVERLQDISEEDAIAEGIKTGITDGYRMTYDYLKKEFLLYDPQGSYKSLWQLINGEESWELNPFVWVITFKKLED